MKSKAAVGVIIVIVAIIVLSGCFTLKPNNTALVVRFGKVIFSTDVDGLHFRVPFIDNVVTIYTGDYFYDIPTSDVITSDKKSMIADDYLIWNVTEPLKYYQTLGAVKGRAEERIEAAVFNATKNTISSMTQDEIIAARGSLLRSMITKASNSDISQYGVNIKVAEIKALDLPDDNKEAVYERMISERNNIAAGYTAKGKSEAQKIKNETDKEVAEKKAEAEKEAAKIRAEAEAKYMQILADAYNSEEKAEFYDFIRSLDAIGSLKSGNNKTIILDKDSEFAKILYGK